MQTANLSYWGFTKLLSKVAYLVKYLGVKDWKY